MNSRPLFSIVTCTYNAGKTIGRTLQSVSSQSFRSFEHIIVDGASKDDTLSVIGSQGASLPTGCLSVVSERDKGLYDAMNKGILRARGHYVIFLNAGDVFHSAETLAQVAAHIYNIIGEAEVADDSRLPVVVYGETDLVDDSGRFLRHRRLQAPEVLTWRSFINGMLVCHQSFYVRRDVAFAEPYNLDYRFSADFDWCIRCLRHASALQILNTHLILTDYLAEGMTTANHKASLIERFRIMSRHYGLLRTVMQHAWFCVRVILKK